MGAVAPIFFGNMVATESIRKQYQESNVATIFGRNKVEVLNAGIGAKIDVYPFLRNPADFHGDPHVDHVVLFNGTFLPLIGEFDPSKFGEWNPDKLPDQGIVVLEHHYHDAADLVLRVDKLAQRIIKDPKLYDDLVISEEYYDLAKEGYNMLARRAENFRIGHIQGVPVSLERAGLVTTRLALGLEKNAVVPNEVRVVTKRTHLKEGPEEHLTVTVNWRDREHMKQQVNGKRIDLADFVNPASGASTAALLVACKQNGVLPSQLVSHSFSMTRQGVLFMKRALEDMDVKPIFYSVGECDKMNNAYYLMGKAVADAGHILRHHLPQDLQ